ncbi:MAG TPA: porin [Albitalea sp.]
MSSRSTTLLAAAAAGLCFSTAAPAQDITLYGLLDMTAGSFQAPGAERVWRADSGGMTTSFVGFKGTEDLGGGLKAKFVINHFLRVDEGSAGRFNGDAFWARDAYVGLSGAFGTSTLGRNTTPLFVSTLLFNAFGDSFAFSPSIRQLFTPALLPFFGDTGWNNSLAYASAPDGNWSWNLIGNLGEGAAGAQGKNLGANLLYFNGPLAASAAWQIVKNGAFGTPPNFIGQRTWQLGVSYDLDVAKLFGQYTRVKTSAAADTKTALWSVGAAVSLGGGKLLAQYGHARARVAGSEPTHKTLSIGYDLDLSKRTDVYAVFMNEKLSGLSGANTLAAGVRTRF